MKKLITVALLSALVATPALADESTSKKPANAAPSGQKSNQKMAGMKDKCDARHEMGGYQGYGMMGGQGAGMMAGMMMEPDMHLLGAVALSEDQQSKINKISDEFKHNNWATQGLMNDETAKLRDLYEADKRDPVAIGKEYQKVFDLKRQMIESYLETENRIEEILTPEQRAKLKEMRRSMHHMYGHPMQ